MKIINFLCIITISLLTSCGQPPSTQNEVETPAKPPPEAHLTKPVIYQLLPRLFGNKRTTMTPWGTIEQNGVGKFTDINHAALEGIKQLGVTHIWYTGVLHHASVTDYSDFDIQGDDPDIVKGRAGSPYAIKDYYTVSPDLAAKPSDRMAQFSALIDRTHQHGMKVIIDLVPNHVARSYHSISKPSNISDFGENDNQAVTYQRDNNFYYVPNKAFKVPNKGADLPLGGQEHPLSDGQFYESPAKWTGNGNQTSKPNKTDWYETVKINYGVKPDGSYDFPRLEKQLAGQDYRAHFAFWQDKSVPDSWLKMRDIALFWLQKGVDGFRFAEVDRIPVEFWSFLNSAIKMHNNDAFLVAQMSQPPQFSNYLKQGKFDYIQTNTVFYPLLKAIVQSNKPAPLLLKQVQKYKQVEQYLIRFIENHDLTRIASKQFAGDAQWGKPAMALVTLVGRAPVLLYFGQTVGEDAAQSAGFSEVGRTSIFDYTFVPEHQKWMNDGLFDGAKLAPWQQQLRQFYIDLMALNHLPAVVAGEMSPLINNKPASVVSFSRELAQQRIVVIINFNHYLTEQISINLPAHLQQHTQITPLLIDGLSQTQSKQIVLNQGELQLPLPPKGVVVLQLAKE